MFHRIIGLKYLFPFGRGGGGQVVSVLAFYSENPILSPAEAYSFSVKFVLKRTKLNKKRPGLSHLKISIPNIGTFRLNLNDCCQES